MEEPKIPQYCPYCGAGIRTKEIKERPQIMFTDEVSIVYNCGSTYTACSYVPGYYKNIKPPVKTSGKTGGCEEVLRQRLIESTIFHDEGTIGQASLLTMEPI